VAAIDQALLFELDRHPRSTAEELSSYLRGEAPKASKAPPAAPTIRAHATPPVRTPEPTGRHERVSTDAVLRWLRSHEGWLVRRDARRWRLSPQGESFLAALD
jgi:hypothetical protein